MLCEHLFLSRSWRQLAKLHFFWQSRCGQDVIWAAIYQLLVQLEVHPHTCTCRILNKIKIIFFILCQFEVLSLSVYLRTYFKFIKYLIWTNLTILYDINQLLYLSYISQLLLFSSNQFPPTLDLHDKMAHFSVNASIFSQANDFEKSTGAKIMCIKYNLCPLCCLHQ